MLWWQNTKDFINIGEIMVLLIYNNACKLSTVLSAFLEISHKEFEKIYVVFPNQYDAQKDYNDFGGKVEFITPVKKHSLSVYLKTFLQLLSADVIKDFLHAIKRKKMGASYIKRYINTLITANVLYNASSDVLEKNKENICVFSTWYSANAVAAAKAKKLYPDIFSASYAHSYEVDFRKNNFTTLVCDRFKEKYLDEVYFISEMVMDEYIERNKAVLSFTDKYKAIHFGSRKKRDELSASSSDGTFRIVTCSGISPVKRLHILAEALSLYKGNTPVEWTVLGNGPDMDKVKAIAENVKANNVSIIFKGSVSNDDVHNFYAENPVDLFVNVSESEGLPVSIMEAMSYAIPSLATDAGGNHEIVTEKTGYPISLEITPDFLCKKITEIVENRGLCKEKRADAYEMWSNNYRIEENVIKVLERLKKGND